MSGRPGRSNRVRYVGGDREERVEEEESAVYANVESLKEATGDQGVQRASTVKRSGFRACAVCVTVLCVLLAAGIVGVVMYYQSEMYELQTKYDNVTLERDHLQSEVNQLKRERAVKSCPSGWKKFGCSCYYRSIEEKTWEKNREQCLKTGADMVIINSKEEQEFIRELTTGGQYGSWIGLNRTAGKWMWLDGTPLTTPYWGSGWPNDEGNNCALFWHKAGGWTNAACSRTAYWMCEK